jgi:hypothetical protein
MHYDIDAPNTVYSRFSSLSRKALAIRQVAERRAVAAPPGNSNEHELSNAAKSIFVFVHVVTLVKVTSRDPPYMPIPISHPTSSYTVYTLLKI